MGPSDSTDNKPGSGPRPITDFDLLEISNGYTETTNLQIALNNLASTSHIMCTYSPRLQHPPQPTPTTTAINTTNNNDNTHITNHPMFLQSWQNNVPAAHQCFAQPNSLTPIINYQSNTLPPTPPPTRQPPQNTLYTHCIYCPDTRLYAPMPCCGQRLLCKIHFIQQFITKNMNGTSSWTLHMVTCQFCRCTMNNPLFWMDETLDLFFETL